MNRPRLSTVVGVVVAVVAVGGALLFVREVFGCTPPRDQADMVDLFMADPFLDTAPTDSQLVGEHAHTHACDSAWATGGSPTGPGFAEVMRLYTTPASYSSEDLHQQFDQPAAAAGWRLDEARSQPEHSGGSVRVVYCKEAGGRASHANVSSTIYKETAEDQTAPAVRVILSASRDETTCFLG